MYERLIKCGFTAQMAQDICILYADDPRKRIWVCKLEKRIADG